MLTKQLAAYTVELGVAGRDFFFGSSSADLALE